MIRYKYHTAVGRALLTGGKRAKQKDRFKIGLEKRRHREGFAADIGYETGHLAETVAWGDLLTAQAPCAFV